MLWIRLDKLDHFNHPKAFREYSDDMLYVYKNTEDYNPDKKRKVLIAFYDMIVGMINNKKTKPSSNRIVY